MFVYKLRYCSVLPLEYCQRYAKAEDISGPGEEKSSDDELSEDDSDSSDEAVAGNPDP